MTQDTPTSTSSSSGMSGESRRKNYGFFKNAPLTRKESSKAELLSSSISEETSSPRDFSISSFPSSPVPMSATSATHLLPFSSTEVSYPAIVSPIGGPGTLIDANAFPLIDETATEGDTDEVFEAKNTRDLTDQNLLSNTVNASYCRLSPGDDTSGGIRSSSTASFNLSSSTAASPSVAEVSKPEVFLQDLSETKKRFKRPDLTTTSCSTTMTTTTTTTCSNGSTPRIKIPKKRRYSHRRERCLLVLTTFFALLSTCLLVLYIKDIVWKSSSPSKPAVCSTPDCLRAASRLLDRMDRSVSPCENFYQYACGNYLEVNVVPDDAPYRSAMQEMQEDVLVIIKKMLNSQPSVNESEAMGSARRLYHSCMNTSFTVHEKDMADSPIFDLLTEENLGVWPMLNDPEMYNETSYDLERFLGQLTIYQVHAFFDSYITPDVRNSSVYTLQFYKGSPAMARSYYLNSTNEEYVGYISAYKVLMEEVVTALSSSSSFNSSQIDELIAFETKFAMITDSRDCEAPDGNTTDGLNVTMTIDDDEENFGRMTVAELDLMTPEIKWSRLIQFTLDDFDDMNLDVNNLMVTLHCTSYVPELIKLLAETPKRVIANYLLWRFLMKYLPYVSNYFQQLWQQFRTEVPDPFEERTYISRWKECAADVNEGFGAALAAMYVHKYYDMSTSEKIDSLVEEVRSAFNRVIYRQTWLESEMKDVCSDKLYLMGKKIGFPEYIENVELLDKEFEGLDILEDHFLNNILRMKKYEVWKELKKLTRPVDKKKDWLIQPLIVNAFHNPTANEIIIPLGILREPFYNPGYPMYLNYGSLGVVVGHELVHGFDNHGNKYDKHGNVSQWWSENMVEQFTERATCFVDQYSQYPIEMVGKNVDGNETLGDNICDNTGLLNAWLAYQSWLSKNGPEPSLPGLNYTVEQIFFISFGQIWCEVVSKEGYEKYSTDMHSPGIHRTNGVLQNSEFFSETWGCPMGSTMNPEKKCKLWV